MAAAAAALMLLPACAFALEDASAADRAVVLPEGVDEAAFGDNAVYYDGECYVTLTDELEGVFTSFPEGVAEFYCKPGADVGGMTHGHVADSMVIYGNGAQVTSDERDLELDTYKCNRVTDRQDVAAGAFLEKDVTVTVKSLDGIAAWGQRNTAHTINLVFEDCKDMQRIYFTNTGNIEGVINISLDGCSFDGTADGDLVANVGTAADIMVQKRGYFGASGEVADATQGSMTGVAESDVVKPSEDDHFVVDTHDSVELVGAKDATCTEEGYTGDKVCTVCGKVVEQGSAIGKLAHTYKDGVCTVCGAEDPDYVAPQQPGDSSDSEDEGTGEGNGGTTLPQTGDASFAVIGLALVAMIVSAASLFAFRKRTQL